MPKRLSHTQFLESLSANNEHYREGFFKVTSTYINSRSKIELETKYGKCVTSVKHLMDGNKPTILIAVNKTDYFKSKLLEVNSGYKNGDFCVVGDYIEANIDILIRDKFGLCQMTPTMLLSGSQPTIRAAVDKTEYFCNRLRSINNFYKSGEFDVVGEYTDSCGLIDVTSDIGILKKRVQSLYTYTGKESKSPTTCSETEKTDKNKYYLKRLSNSNKGFIKKEFEVVGLIEHSNPVILKTKYGLCSMSISNLLAGKCPNIVSALNKNEYFINRAREVHGDKFNYDSVDYKTNKDNVTIICKEHGPFQQSPGNHLSGKGCLLCQQEGSSFGRNSWCNKISKGRDATLYVIRFYSEDEDFIKVGLTLRSVKQRYSYRIKKYNMETLYLLKTPNKELAWDLEAKIKNDFRNERYTPLEMFAGAATETFKICQKDAILDLVKLCEDNLHQNIDGPETIESRHFFL
jgi:hypothetical protein